MIATAIYRAIMLELERRRLQLGWTMEEVCEVAGIQDRYYAKLLYCDEKSGRQARWETLEILMLTLFPEGYIVKIDPTDTGMLTPMSMKHRIKHASPAGTIGRRQELTEMAKKATEARKAIPPRKRRAIARRAARARWKRQKFKHAPTIG